MHIISVLKFFALTLLPLAARLQNFRNHLPITRHRTLKNFTLITKSSATVIWKFSISPQYLQQLEWKICFRLTINRNRILKNSSLTSQSRAKGFWKCTISLYYHEDSEIQKFRYRLTSTSKVTLKIFDFTSLLQATVV
jgi:hypothetical protein